MQPPSPESDREAEDGCAADGEDRDGGAEEDRLKRRVRRHRGPWTPARPWIPPDRYPRDIAKGTIFASSLIDGRYSE